jgi:hypothetical protein
MEMKTLNSNDGVSPDILKAMKIKAKNTTEYVASKFKSSIELSSLNLNNKSLLIQMTNGTTYRYK